MVAEYTGLVTAFLLAALALLAGAATIRLWPLIDTRGISREPSAHWAEPNLAFEPDPDVGPVLVTTTYTIAENLEEAFLRADGRGAVVAATERSHQLGTVSGG